MPGIKQNVAGRPAWLALLGILVLHAGGCTPQWVATPSDVKQGPAPLPLPKVKTAGACMDLTEAQKPAMGRDEFVDKMGKILANQQHATAAAWVRRYPDMAWDVLRNATTTDAGNATVRFIAKVHDQHCCVNGESINWMAMLDDRIAHPEGYKAFDAASARVHELEHNSKSTEIGKLAMGLQAPHPLLEIEACRLAGDSLLQANQTAEAIMVLTKGYEQAKEVAPYVAAHISLLLGEVQRRSGQTDQGAATWKRSVSLAQRLLDASPPIADPELWVRLAALRPANANWPATGNSPHAKEDNAVAETQLWKKIGKWRLERAEYQTALFAFKRAESLAPDQGQRDELQLLQANALLHMNQEAAAVTMLARLVEQQDPSVAAPALALLGSIKLKQGDRKHAMALLQRAVDWPTLHNWPGRAEAEADLGLAYLMAGDEGNGLHCLHNAQAHFQTENAGDILVQCLANEVNYLEHKGNRDQAARVREHIHSLEASVAR